MKYFASEEMKRNGRGKRYLIHTVLSFVSLIRRTIYFDSRSFPIFELLYVMSVWALNLRGEFVSLFVIKKIWRQEFFPLSSSLKLSGTKEVFMQALLAFPQTTREKAWSLSQKVGSPPNSRISTPPPPPFPPPSPPC